MMKLPALTEIERAWVNQVVPLDATKLLAQAIAERIRLQLQAMLGIRIEIVASQVFSPIQQYQGVQPQIKMDAALAAMWIDLRYGGWPSKSVGRHRADWLFTLEQDLRSALAAAVVNQDCSDAWPQAMQVRLQIGHAQGAIDINLNKETVRSWAWQHIRITPIGR